MRSLYRRLRELLRDLRDTEHTKTEAWLEIRRNIAKEAKSWQATATENF